MSDSNLKRDREIEVAWTMSDPPLQAEAWYDWKDFHTEGDDPVEIGLGWPSGTLSYLRHAFRLNLPRNRGWSDPNSNPALQKAASLYKRGVACSSEANKKHSGAYTISIKGLHDLDAMSNAGHLLLIDARVAKVWLKVRTERCLVLDLDENRKTLKSVIQISNWLRSQAGDLNIVGGGLLADVGAFAAALNARSFHLIPTTLLAMVDACVGGKTGVNFEPFGKNQLGLFAFPKSVRVCTSWLASLDERQIHAGLAEAFKHALLKGDRTLAAQTCSLEHDAIPTNLAPWIRVKAEIIAEDPTEEGRRATLNLGHTLAHALERISHFASPTDPLLHGEAVAVGLLFCVHLSQYLGHLPSHVSLQIQDLLQTSVFRPKASEVYRRLGELSQRDLFSEILKGVGFDKKNRSENTLETQWVLLEDWGMPVVKDGRYTVGVKEDVLRECLTSFFRDVFPLQFR